MISFAVIFLIVVVMMSFKLQATGNVMKYLGMAWVLLAIVLYPLAKKIIRN